MSKTQRYDYIGKWRNWSVYRNSDGFLEGMRGIGKVLLPTVNTDNHQDLERVVTNTRTLDDFKKYVTGLKARKKPPSEDELKGQLGLFPEPSENKSDNEKDGGANESDGDIKVLTV